MRLAASAVVALIADAVALLVAALLIDDVELGASGFIVAVAVFALVDVLVQPLLRQLAIKSTPALLGSVALVSTLVSLIVAAVLTDGLSISGLGTWVLATVVVWAVALAARLLLPLVIFKRVLGEARDRRNG